MTKDELEKKGSIVSADKRLQYVKLVTGKGVRG
jgi:hypothetical protein